MSSETSAICPECDGRYERLGSHWSHPHTSCDYPDIEDDSIEILTGYILGDGSLDLTTVNPRVDIQMTSPLHLKHIDDELGWLSTGVSQRRTPKESSDAINKSLQKGTSAIDCQYLYGVKTRSHPQLDVFSQWYDNGRFQIPDGIEVSRTAVKHWYVSDGCLHWDKGAKKAYVKIGSMHHSNNPEPLVNLLSNHGWNITHRDVDFILEPSQTEEFLDWIGKPCCSDFTYKWSWQDYEQYMRLNEESHYGVGKEVELD